MINPSICGHANSEIIRYPNGSGLLYCKTCGVEMLKMTPPEFALDWERKHQLQQRRDYSDLYTKPKKVGKLRSIGEKIKRLLSQF